MLPTLITSLILIVAVSIWLYYRFHVSNVKNSLKNTEKAIEPNMQGADVVKEQQDLLEPMLAAVNAETVAFDFADSTEPKLMQHPTKQLINAETVQEKVPMVAIAEPVLEPIFEDAENAKVVATAQEALAIAKGESHQLEIYFDADERKQVWSTAVQNSFQRRVGKHVESPAMKPGVSSMTWTKVSSEPLDAILSIYVLAGRSKRYKGSELLSLLKKQNLVLGEKEIFEYRSSSEEVPLFYVASAINPGTFDADTAHSMETKGLAFFMDCSALTQPKQAFTKMLAIVHNVASSLQADILDARRERLTESGIVEYLVKIKTISGTKKYAR